ncbi:uncharacterized protein LOC106641533 [Copidosoma floridanum]|uniref:uncharacterized protein LOC106641533 n=1 Tax=Copidosoma floridanum TaxID=29053 RepID=UPI0006C995EC|nr:uncharacterized protein LOC106641533 [Copidosoma floridanum]XP_014211481.1 uncharacterized protein LOC106641533 [Copidosoma floridanum]
MTVYGPYLDTTDYFWYVDVMTPNGAKKVNIMNPLYYFKMMKVEPPVGSKFSQYTIDDYEDLLLENNNSNIDVQYSNLEPYQNLEKLPCKSSCLAHVLNTTGIIPVNAQPNSIPLIPLTTPSGSTTTHNQINQLQWAVEEITKMEPQKSVSLSSLEPDPPKYELPVMPTGYDSSNFVALDTLFPNQSSQGSENNAAGYSYDSSDGVSNAPMTPVAYSMYVTPTNLAMYYELYKQHEKLHQKY